ncbi:hypothetical protein INN71_03560 [Nocardioides sp. ChNu-153]|uniref:hypothetical protein n=1 Tax=unclassified Nocardioides TaxID=2615069 RepID=UPI0024060AA9|nr:MULTISPECIES: hypothetical protein [unclassified Nocardioides]MDF9717475.1 hypothetical protein [Nocardioides sp. ChNu-99]MDN7120465.1 hypothetical protein [Nocardioides sp. ChNu-153]
MLFSRQLGHPPWTRRTVTRWTLATALAVVAAVALRGASDTVAGVALLVAVGCGAMTLYGVLDRLVARRAPAHPGQPGRARRSGRRSRPDAPARSSPLP